MLIEQGQFLNAFSNEISKFGAFWLAYSHLLKVLISLRVNAQVITMFKYSTLSEHSNCLSLCLPLNSLLPALRMEHGQMRKTKGQVFAGSIRETKFISWLYIRLNIPYMIALLNIAIGLPVSRICLSKCGSSHFRRIPIVWRSSWRKLAN